MKRVIKTSRELSSDEIQKLSRKYGLGNRGIANLIKIAKKNKELPEDFTDSELSEFLSEVSKDTSPDELQKIADDLEKEGYKF